MGAGAGSGLACARAFAARGSELLLADVDAATLRRVVDETGGLGLFCDVASEASVAVFAAEVQRTFASLDLLINAAGKSYVRTLGTMRVSRALLPVLKQDGRRKDIVNIAQMDPGADDGPFPYAASTEAFECLSDALAENIRGTKLVLTTIMPRLRDHEVSGDVSPLEQPWGTDQSEHRRYYCEVADRDALAAKIVATIVSPMIEQPAPEEKDRRKSG